MIVLVFVFVVNNTERIRHCIFLVVDFFIFCYTNLSTYVKCIQSELGPRFWLILFRSFVITIICYLTNRDSFQFKPSWYSCKFRFSSFVAVTNDSICLRCMFVSPMPKIFFLFDVIVVHKLLLKAFDEYLKCACIIISNRLSEWMTKSSNQVKKDWGWIENGVTDKNTNEIEESKKKKKKKWINSKL